MLLSASPLTDPLIFLYMSLFISSFSPRPTLDSGLLRSILFPRIESSSVPSLSALLCSFGLGLPFSMLLLVLVVVAAGGMGAVSMSSPPASSVVPAMLWSGLPSSFATTTAKVAVGAVVVVSLNRATGPNPGGKGGLASLSSTSRG
uniref:Uncharacterized protein n=1 Tax=Triticum urartu TaxID=4572 RepID=A0A8R7P5M2_TRIUA